MPNTITEKIILNGSRLLVLEYQISGDGSGEETATQLVDVSDFACSRVAIRKFVANLDGFAANLLWDATTDVQALAIPEGASGVDFAQVGGPLRNNAGSGITGDIMITTIGLGAGNNGTLRLELVKKA